MLKRSLASNPPVTFQIHVRGVLSPFWSQWFSSAEVLPQTDGTLIITLPVAKRSDLYVLLNHMRDLGLVLLAVRVVYTEAKVA